MASGKRRWPMVLAGIAVVAAVAVIAVAAFAAMFFSENVRVSPDTSRQSAAAAFDGAKRQFTDLRPILEMDADRRPVYTQGLASRRNPGTVTSVQIMAWDAHEDTLATVTLPIWLLRLKSGPILFGQYASGLDERGVRLDPKDLDRYGPGVVLEFEAPNGDHILVTAQ